MGFRVVNKSYFAVETDLPRSIRNIHPSGILHAFRYTDTNSSTINNSSVVTGNNNDDDDDDNDDDNNINYDKYIGNNDVIDNLILCRQEHTFVWIENSLHIEVALSHLEQPQHGFDREWGIVFIPYSTKRNWIDRYPHAKPTLDCLVDGTLAVNVTNDVTKLNNNVRGPYLNDLGGLETLDNNATNEDADDDGENGDGGTASVYCTNDESLENDNSNYTKNEGANAATATTAENATSTPKKRKKEKKKRYDRRDSLLRSKLYIRDPERDELHIAIYNYLSWLHVKLSEVLEIQLAELIEYERKKEKQVATMAASSCVDSDTNEDDDDDVDEDSHGGKRRNTGTEKKTKKTSRLRRPTLCTSKGVNLVELKGALDKLESTFAILPNIKREAEEEAAAADLLQKQQEEQKKEELGGEEVGLGVVMVPYEGEGPGEDDDDDESHRGHSREQQQSTNQLPQHDKESGEADLPSSSPQPPKKQQQQKPQRGDRPPFLEEALSTTLTQIVAARNLAGKGRRSRKRKFCSPTSIHGGDRGHSRTTQDFDEFIQQLVQYKEKHGDCLVPRKYKADPKLGYWVHHIRGKRNALRKEGKEFEEIPPNGKVLSKTLTAERLAKLNNIGFVWKVSTTPRLPWEERFQDCMDYYEREGRWPPQSAGRLGEWVHSQRMHYAQRDANFMKYKARQLDVVGFEWTPRGYTRVTWDEGFEMLMDYGRMHGDYDVKPPATGQVDTKSDEFRLYKWVESLHSMYRSYKLGRMPGSLTEERILLLGKHGFSFRNDRVPLDLV